MPRIRRRLRGALQRSKGKREELVTGPIHGELLGAEHLAEHARALARGQAVSPPSPLDPRTRLLSRLDGTESILESGFRKLARQSDGEHPADPAGEWLLDNFHLLQDHIQEVRDALPRRFYRELPELSSGPLSGHPRVFEIAIALISHSEGRIDLENLDTYVAAFQDVAELTIGELWAIPAMLRLGLIENVRRMTLRTVKRLDQLDSADEWTRKIRDASGTNGSRINQVLQEVVADRERIVPTFLSRLMSQLRLTGGTSPALVWLERWLLEDGLKPDDISAQAIHRLAHTQIMMANSITSLRLIGRRDWRSFVERHSAMEAILRRDPAKCHARMTFATRDRYRHAVERLARRSGKSQVEVARKAIELASRSHGGELLAERRRHIGYYLIDAGLSELEAAVGSPTPLTERFIRSIRRHPNQVLVGGLAALTILALIAVGVLAGSHVRRIAWPLILVFTLLPAWDIGISTINQLVMTILRPQVLPSMDFEDGIPEEARTAIVVPTLFGDVASVKEAFSDIEVIALANPDESLRYVILSDFTDAASETMPDDEAIMVTARQELERVNRDRPGDGGDRFCLLHRPRRWNESESTWMGWERKRGKLAEFNRLLRKGDTGGFSMVSCDPAQLATVRYVITLDADTMLPRGAALALVGTLAHPLNRAVYDHERHRMIAGYGILQPRVGVALPSALKSRFARIHAGQPGVDPYTTAVSDVYQDLYGEGSFTGKGIYDVDAFVTATGGRFPENALLSHDLIEGNFARAGLATGIIVYDDYPTRYAAHTHRRHRWIRGDWQLLPWLARRVPTVEGAGPNRLSLVSRWKIIDNLRRSTVEIAQLALILAGWLVLAGTPIRWTLLGLGAIAAPWVVSLLLATVKFPGDRSWRAYYGAVWRDAGNSLEQFALAVAFLPHKAWLSMDAIVRTLYRLGISRKHLLEWQSAAQVDRSHPRGLVHNWRLMWPAIAVVTVIAIIATAELIWFHETSIGKPGLPWRSLLGIWPLTLVWLVSPWFATWLDQPIQKPVRLREHECDLARRHAERYWRFFERYATAETHWLAPDNVQSAPEERVALRTSATNIGLQVLATVSAHDLGLLTIAALLQHLEPLFDTIESLDKDHGHLYNWYSLEDLSVLQPAYISTVDSGNLAGHLIAFAQACKQLADKATSEDRAGDAERLVALAGRAMHIVAEMDFGFLLDPDTKLFTVGHHPGSNTNDGSHYDLLMSEARLASFIAIAKGDIPAEAWHRLGRPLTRVEGRPVLLSWTGSMFEYLMPVLVMRSYPTTLLDRSHQGAIEAQINHGIAQRVPWGMSESAYNVRDKELTYQYRAFGVPQLALKRLPKPELVVAPYASALAAQLAPRKSLANLDALEQLGAFGPWGDWDALDFTRHPPGDRVAVVKTVMAHHTGMAMVALTNVLGDEIWQERFHTDPMVRSAELLLQERMPRLLTVHSAPSRRLAREKVDKQTEPAMVRLVHGVESAQPRVALLGDLPYTVMVTHAGSGWSKWNSLAVNRWRADGTRDQYGQFCYVHDLSTDRYWSAGFQPTCARPDRYRAELAPDRVTINRKDGDIETRTEIVVVRLDSAEVRRVTLVNHGSETREIELTSFAEVVMASAESDAAHPAFSNLFIETEWHSWCSALTARRRPRQLGEDAPWCVHVVDRCPCQSGEASCETDRHSFIGRGRSTARPAVMDAAGPLSGTTGAVLDPVLSLRIRVRVPAGGSATVAFTTLVAETRERAFELADRYHEPHASQRALDLAWMATQIDLQEVGISSDQSAVFEELAGKIIHGRSSLSPPADVLARNVGSQPLLWARGISGDLPIVLAMVDGSRGMPTLRELFIAHRYWRRHGLRTDLVVLIDHPHDYMQELKQSIQSAMQSAGDATAVDAPGGVYIRRRDEFEPDQFLMLAATARLQLACDGRSLASIVPDIVARARRDGRTELTPIGAMRRVRPRASTRGRVDPDPGIEWPGDNGVGEPASDGGYRIVVAGDRLPPQPWSNVIANESAGFLVTERGSGSTWVGNSHFFRLTPWHNDPVSAPVSDVIYLRDDRSGDAWAATPGPIPNDCEYQVYHEAGRSRFVHCHDGLWSELTMGVAREDPVKLSLLRLTNNSGSRRTIGITVYSEWTLGVDRESTQHQIVTSHDEASDALLARNTFNPAFADRVAFLSVSGRAGSYTCDRREFIGRNGSLADPAGLRRAELAGRVGPGYDPCGALLHTLVLAPGESSKLAVVLGAGSGNEAAAELIERYRTVEAVENELAANFAAWRDRLDIVQVSTPDSELDAMLNHWALYQALSCRMWARSALYQSSGAYGFRDQLQDVMGFVYAEPAVAREHLLRAASRQFVEGDVQHWWHPETGRGVRTRFSDDLAWLPYSVAHYVNVTGDDAVLNEEVKFLKMRELGPDEHELYDLPEVADGSASLHQHCLRALRRACTSGPHGLPLIGSGDWNDGFSRVGIEGKGESVWLGWFLIACCRDYAEIAEQHGDEAAAVELRRHADHYVEAIEEAGWDGAWYRRAYYDDGAPMGSTESDDCQIDSIAQSWSIISGAGKPERQRQAMVSLEKRLVSDEARLIRLLTPPFDDGAHDPGYIKGYLPGVRENGAQYTHAALWAVLATAMMGDGNRAMELYRYLNPFTHTATPDGVAKYQVEPYVVAADVYTATGHLGRGGWTWYTGSASWMYRVGLEGLLGFRLRGDKLAITPAVPDSWPRFEIRYRYRSSSYLISVESPGKITADTVTVTVDGQRMADGVIHLVDDGVEHEVKVEG